jgi:hypothetical protein
MQEKKPMLLVISGLGWSPPCNALKSDLFDNTAFKNLAAEHLVLSYLNVPTTSPDVEDPQDIKLRQFEAMKRYRSFLKVKKLPTLLLFDSEGRELKRIEGYGITSAARVVRQRQTMEHLVDCVEREVERVKKFEAHRKELIAVQGYRDWQSTLGGKLFAKLVEKIEIPTGKSQTDTEPGVSLMNAEGKRIPIRLRQLSQPDLDYLQQRWQTDDEKTFREVPSVVIPVEPPSVQP